MRASANSLLKLLPTEYSDRGAVSGFHHGAIQFDAGKVEGAGAHQCRQQR
jgi:hypothetical protein